MSFDTDLFIVSIEQKKSIWDTSFSDYKNREVKIKDWENIGETMNLHFKDFTGEKKEDFIKELQKKWKSLRDAFRKEHTKYDKSGSQASKKSKYCYYDALSFLTPTFTVRQTSGNISFENTMDTDDDNTIEFLPDTEIATSTRNHIGDLDTSMNTPSPTLISRMTKPAKKKNAGLPSTFQQQLLKVLDKSQNEDDDDDKYFLLSLLPGIKEIDTAYKMDALCRLYRNMPENVPLNQLHHIVNHYNQSNI